MADSFGKLLIPLPAPPAATSPTGYQPTAADPLIDYSLAFFQAFLNANAPVAWQAVFKDLPSAPPVLATFAEDPTTSAFTDNLLPALFMYRESAEEPEWIAEDWLTQKSVCRLLWVMPPTVFDKRAFRVSICGAIARTLLVGVERYRDPSWIVAGDPDPDATTYGSVLNTFAGWMEFYVGKWKPMQLKIPMNDRGARPRQYDALSIDCLVTEKLNYDVDRFPGLREIDVTIKTPDVTPGDGFVTEQFTLTSTVDPDE